MLESGSSGSVRGASSNGRPYREPGPGADLRDRPYAGLRPKMRAAPTPVAAVLGLQGLAHARDEVTLGPAVFPARGDEPNGGASARRQQR